MTDAGAVASVKSPSARPLAPGARLAEIDMLRGLVIVIMALDHVRDYFHAGAFAFNPLDPAQTTPLLYATRWITHLCAPTFVFLAGVSAFLQSAKGKTGFALAGFLLTRGLWLVVIELTLISFGWSFSFPYPPMLQVIWAIGCSMIALAGLVLAPRTMVLAIGLALVLGHNLLDPLTPEQFGGGANLWTLLHEGGPIFFNGAPVGFAAYPILPWVGVIALGYGAGPLLLAPAKARDPKLLAIGAIMVAAFVLLRWFDLYGNPAAPAGWRDQDTAMGAVMVFLDVQKYPPSLMFLLVTLGLSAMLLPVLARLRGPVAGVLVTFGAVPFFFYVLHIYLAHGMAIGAHVAVGRDASGLFGYLQNAFTAPERLEALGFSLPWVYVAWLVVLALLYPLCAYWAALKRRRRDWWLSYL